MDVEKFMELMKMFQANNQPKEKEQSNNDEITKKIDDLTNIVAALVGGAKEGKAEEKGESKEPKKNSYFDAMDEDEEKTRIEEERVSLANELAEIKLVANSHLSPQVITGITEKYKESKDTRQAINHFAEAIIYIANGKGEGVRKELEGLAGTYALDPTTAFNIKYKEAVEKLTDKNSDPIQQFGDATATSVSMADVFNNIEALARGDTSKIKDLQDIKEGRAKRKIEKEIEEKNANLNAAAERSQQEQQKTMIL